MSIRKAPVCIAPAVQTKKPKQMRQDAKRSIHVQQLHPTDTPTGDIPNMDSVRKAYNAWLDRRGFQREKFRMHMINRRAAK